MALNIRPSSPSSSTNSTSSSSSAKSCSTELFAQGMAAAAKNAQKAAASKQAKPVATPKPKLAAHESNATDSKPAKSSGAGAQQKAARSAQTAAAQSGQYGSAPDDAATAAQANADGNTVAKGRAPSRATPKNTPAQTTAANKANNADPNSDTANESGLSLIQLLAKSLQGDDSTAPSSATDGTAPAAADKPSTDGTDPTSGDPNAIALAMFSQALAATLSRQAPANVASANTGDAAAAGIGSATDSPSGAESMQDLMTVLAHDVAAGAKGKSDDGAAQFIADTTKGAASDAGSQDASALGPNALAHLGVASHFAAQHLRNDTNTADIQSQVGSSAWEDEVGNHLTWMSQKGLETGSLRVSPEHLGPVEVNISVQDGNASVWFAANHPDTRAALEQALPKLREMFANQGMNLADSGVSRQSTQQGSRNQSRSAASQAVSGVSAIGTSDAGSTSSSRLNLGLVDLYA